MLVSPRSSPWHCSSETLRYCCPARQPSEKRRHQATIAVRVSPLSQRQIAAGYAYHRGMPWREVSQITFPFAKCFERKKEFRQGVVWGRERHRRGPTDRRSFVASLFVANERKKETKSKNQKTNTRFLTSRKRPMRVRSRSSPSRSTRSLLTLVLASFGVVWAAFAFAHSFRFRSW